MGSVEIRLGIGIGSVKNGLGRLIDIIPIIDIHNSCLPDAERIIQRNLLSGRGINPILDRNLFGFPLGKIQPEGLQERWSKGIHEHRIIDRLPLIIGCFYPK